jgi:hypothetical protein
MSLSFFMYIFDTPNVTLFLFNSSINPGNPEKVKGPLCIGISGANQTVIKFVKVPFGFSIFSFPMAL